MATRQRYCIGVDLGASKILVGLVAPDGRVIARFREATPTGGADEWVEQVLRLVRAAAAEAKPDPVRAVAVGVPGVVDPVKGTVRWIQNLPFISDLPLAGLLSRELDCPVTLENDVDLLALGEHRFGAGVGTRHMVLVAVGTGIGAGLILNGCLYRGSTGLAGAIGWFHCDHPKVAMENLPTLEQVAAGPAVARRAAELLRVDPASGRGVTAGIGLAPVACEEVIRAARSGNELCLQVVSEAVRHLGLAVASVISLLNPQVVVLAGGMLTGNLWLVDEIGHVALTHAQPLAGRATRVVPALLGEDAGLIGSIPAAEQAAGLQR